MKLFLVLISAALVLFFASSHADLRAVTGCRWRLMPLRCTLSTDASNPPAAKDVKRVIAAAYRDHLDDTLVHLYLTVNRARKAGKGTREWAFVIEEGVPGLADRVGRLADAARVRVATVEVKTPAGRRFRAVALRGLRLEGLFYRAFAHDLAAKQPTLKAFNRWGARINALHRWYLVQFQSVVAAAALNDRAAVEDALSQY
jgi:hypothetical protein